jgi:plastocyanin
MLFDSVPVRNIEPIFDIERIAEKAYRRASTGCFVLHIDLTKGVEIMRHFLNVTITLTVLAALSPAFASTTAKQPSSTVAQTYTVTVGWENPREGIGINAFFPETVSIHVGDTVHWVLNTNEIHTVTFLAGTKIPALIVPAAQVGLPSSPSPLVFNPTAVNPAGPSNGKYDGSVYANSGLMGRSEGQVQEFDLAFTSPGTYDYVCIVHGSMMSGQIVVVAPSTHIASPRQVAIEAHRQIAQQRVKVPSVLAAARDQIKPDTKNADGTVTHTVMIGYADGQIDLMKFFPDRLTVAAGDTVKWEMSPSNMAPHTVTFLNGEQEPELVIPVSQPSGPPVLYANPAVFFPSQPTPKLTRMGIYNSGVMDPVPGTTFTLVIGDVSAGPQPYMCLLHNESGMEASLTICPRAQHPFPWPWTKGQAP